MSDEIKTRDEAIKEIFEYMPLKEIIDLAESMREVKHHGFGMVLIYIRKGKPIYNIGAKGKPMQTLPDTAALIMAGIPGDERHVGRH